MDPGQDPWGDLEAAKVPGAANPADLMTKHVTAKEIQKHCEDLCVELCENRAESAPKFLAARHAPQPSPDPQDGHHDEWREDAGEATRVHWRPRRDLFTPMRVAGAPPSRALTNTRIAKGKFVGNGEAFAVTDSWRARAPAHLDLEREWTGTTIFIRISVVWGTFQISIEC